MTINLLMFQRDPRWYGGVVNYISQLKQHFSEQIKTHDFVIGQRKYSHFGWFVYPVSDAIRLIGIVFGKKMDVYHLNPSLRFNALIRDGGYLLVLKLSRTAKVLVFFHGWDKHVAETIRKTAWLRKLFLFVFSRADKIVVLADDFSKSLQDIGVLQEKLMLATTMFDGRLFSKHMPRKADNTRRPALLFLSRLEKEKGIFELLQAFSMVASEFDVTLNIAGEGSEKDAVADWIKSHGLADRISLLGYVRDADKTRVFYNNDIYILPSYAEGLPVSLLEAMAAGLACIVTAVGAIPNVIEDAVNGCLIEPRDVEDLRQKITLLVKDNKLRIAMSEANLRDAWSKYEAAAVTQNIESVYKKLCVQ